MLDPLQPFIEVGDELDRFDPDDPQAAEEARAYLKDHPGVAAAAGDLALHAETQLIKLICHDDQRATAVLKEKLDQLRADLSHDNDPPMLGLLTNRVVLDWLWVHFLDLVCATIGAEPGGGSVQLTRKREAAHRMLLAATRTHTTLRKSLGPRRGSFKKPTVAATASHQPPPPSNLPSQPR